MSSPNPSLSQVSGVVLAGGAARRMGGEDKGLLPLNGRPLIAHIIERLQPQCAKLAINCQIQQDGYAAFGLPLLHDSLPGRLGPLAGLLTAMEQAETEFVLTVPCDTPFLPIDLVSRMLAALQQSGAALCSVSDGERMHPVFMLARREGHPALRQYLLSGQRKVHHWFCSQSHCLCDFSDQPEAFFNINTPEQLHAAKDADHD